jgi:hypothetical protein
MENSRDNVGGNTAKTFLIIYFNYYANFRHLQKMIPEFRYHFLATPFFIYSFTPIVSTALRPSEGHTPGPG